MAKQVNRDIRAEALRKMEIDDLATEYRIALCVPLNQPLPPEANRETMIPEILEREFGDVPKINQV